MSSRAAARLAAALLASAVPVHAQRAGVTALPDSTVARIDGIFAALGGPSAPGCGLGVSREAKPLLTRAYGMANLEYSVPNTVETVFESGSVAKQFTAAAVVQLVRDGRLSLDDDIRKYLPEVPDFGKKIAVRNLLTHTSGLRDQWGLLGLQGRGPGTQVHSFATILDLVSHQKALNFDPGAEYLYSNTGYVLAALIVQRVSGMPFARFTEERLFRPLGMTHTRWRDDFTQVVPNRATAYSGTAATGFHMDMPFTNVHGNGGLLTTMGDLLVWNAALDTPPASIGGAEFARIMQTPMVLTSGRRITYALGLDVGSGTAGREVTHGGSTAGYRTWLARFPDQKVSVAVFCNLASANASALGTQVATLVVPGLTRSTMTAAARTPPLAPAELARYAGLFRAARTHDLLRVAVEDSGLVTELPARRALAQSGPDRFALPGQGELQYEVTPAGIRRLLLLAADGDTVVFEPVRAAAVTTAALAAFAGSYWSDEIETRVTVAMKNDTLVLRRRPADELALRPTVTDGFAAPQLGTIAFTRDARGIVNGFDVYAGRVRKLHFSRER